VINLKYIGALADSSGYAAAGRDYCVALLESGKVNLTTFPISFEKDRTDLGEKWKRIAPTVNKQIPYDIQIIHATPENFTTLKDPTKYNIGYVAWETSRLPSGWTELCNHLSEIWVPSTYNIKIFRNSGVRVPIIKIHHSIDKPNLDVAQIPMGQEDTFAFYSIFQWTSRKAPIPLLKAYLTEFSPSENVVLVIKTYRLNTSPQEREAVKQQIQAVKRSLNLSNFPKMMLFPGLMSNEEIEGLHKRGDCFILCSRSEGFSICPAIAMSFGKPVIVSDYGGVKEFARSDNSYLVDCVETPVSGMIFGNYNGHMNWGEPNISTMKKQMRRVFEHRNEAKEIGKRGQETISKEFSPEVIGSLMVDRLNQIQNEITQKKRGQTR